MKIAEIYKSVQGEGFLSGVDSAFVRASGCNLRCWYCDTPYASHAPEGEDLSVEEIVSRIEQIGCGHVVLTGGEPMLFAELIPLTARLRAQRRHITIETAGTLYLPVECDLLSISPKMANSRPDPVQTPRWGERHERTRNAPTVIQQLIDEYPYQFKFVVECVADCEEVGQYLDELPEIDRSRVMLMPQGTDVAALARTAEWLEPYCHDNDLHFCPRRHIEWFGLVRGT
jgi:7-carboxy-7-deazaguanine synthase